MPVCRDCSPFYVFASPYTRAVQHAQCATQGHVRGDFERGGTRSGADTVFVQVGHASLGCEVSGALPFWVEARAIRAVPALAGTSAKSAFTAGCDEQGQTEARGLAGRRLHSTMPVHFAALASCA